MKTLQSVLICTFSTLVMLSAAARAEPDASVDNYQANSIISGQVSEAEQKLLDILKDSPNDPFALLNLAYVYQTSGQEAKAREMYQRILEQAQNPHAELASGKPQRVKTIAQRGIAQLDSKAAGN
jgi:Tfp pilus assembly protein PilF